MPVVDSQISELAVTGRQIDMSACPSNFRRNDVKRAVQAVQAAGLKVARVELHGSKVLIIPSDDDKSDAPHDENEWNDAT